jgi:putative DNA primase/helicase
MIKDLAIVATYDYRDESGELLYQVVRYEPKDFRQRRPDGKGGWIWNLNNTRRVLYRLQELLTADKRQWIFVVEGEKDADRLIDLGLVATTCAMGAVKWQDNYSEFLNDRRVVVIPDNDKPGKKHAQKIAQSLSKVGAEAQIVKLPELPEKGDVSDWLDNGGDKSKLLKLIETTKPSAKVIDTDFNLTDAGNGERFAAQHGRKIRYCWTWGKWLFYDNKRWNITTGEQMANRLAVETARSIIREAEGKNYSERGEILKWSHQSENTTRLAAMLTATKSVLPIAAYAEQFDKNIWLLNCLNGTVDLQTGKLRPHNPADMITKLCPVQYDLEAQLQLWNDFLAMATDGDNMMFDFLQTAIGYSLTGSIAEEKLFFIHGPAASGKSTFLEAVKATFGEYAQTSDFETFLQRKQVGGIRNDIAKLNGARLVASIEVDDGKKLAEGLIKMLTGGDTVSARFLYKESFEFLPQFKLWLAANHAPRVKDDDDAIWRRILRVPFEQVVAKEDRNPKIKATLRNPEIAGSAILAWSVKGCLKWQRDGLIVPEVVKLSTEEYRQSQDPLKDFFDDECEFDLTAFVPVAELREAYDQHAKDNGVRYTLGPREFNKRLRAKGCDVKSKRYANSVGTEKVGKCWQGVTLKSNPQKNEQEQITDEIPF